MVNNKLKFYIKNWYYFGAVLFVALTYIIGFFGEAINLLQKILTLSFMALLVHQFEEYGLPGGFPAIYNNILTPGGSEAPERYPLNQKKRRNYKYNWSIFFLYHTYFITKSDLAWTRADIVWHDAVPDTWYHY